MTVLEKIKDVCSKAVPSYSFEFETAKMMNVNADNTKFPLVFFEEYTARDGRYTIQFGMKKTVAVELSFMRLAPRDNMNADAIDRERIREQIETEAVLPFIEKLNESRYFETVNEFSITPEPCLFDANAVSLLLRFSVTFKIC